MPNRGLFNEPGRHRLTSDARLGQVRRRFVVVVEVNVFVVAKEGGLRLALQRDGEEKGDLGLRPLHLPAAARRL